MPAYLLCAGQIPGSGRVTPLSRSSRRVPACSPTCDTASTLVRISEDGGGTKTLLEGQPGVYPLTARGDHIYWRTFIGGQSDLLRMPIDGASAKVLGSVPGLTFGLAVDDEAIYWATNTAGTVAKLAL